MGNSIQDQLMKAGLANKKQEVRARKAKNTREKMQRKGHDVVDEAKELARRAEAEKAARDRELNRARTEEAERRAVAAQVRQLVAMNRVAERGDVEFRFTEGTAIRTLLVREPQRRALVAGSLAVVSLDGRHDIVPRAVADKIAERDPAAVVLRNERDAPAEGDADDEYAGYEVSDDLMW